MRFRRKRAPKGVELLDGEFLLATVEPRPGQVLEDDLAPAVRSLDDADDRHVLPLFTSEDALRQIYPQGSAWVLVPFADALRLFVAGDWVVAQVDPGNEPTRELSRAEAKELLAHAEA
jgi:type III secretion system (T3SS) SseB-like protein